MNKKYNWSAIREHYDLGYTYRETQAVFGFAAKTWNDAVKRGDIIPRGKVDPNKIISGEYTTKSRYNLKKQIIKFNLIPYVCAKCGNTGTWNDEPLSLQLDHINGINNDDRLKNLRFLCPNCHAQTPTYAGKAKGNGNYNRQGKKNGSVA